MLLLIRSQIAKRRFVVGVVAVSAAVALALGLASTVWSSSGDMGFKNVPASVLASTGLALTPPQASPPMSEAAAAALATKAGGGQSVLEAQYAHCSVPGKVPPINQDCWAFSLNPGGLTSLDGVPATWLLVLIDPASGDVLLTRYGN